MSTHAYHPALEGYHPDQLFVDGCEVCEKRTTGDMSGIVYLDGERFVRAWLRASEWRGSHGHPEEIEATLSNCERRIYSVLWHVILQFERRGIPKTEVPKAHVEQVRDALSTIFTPSQALPGQPSTAYERDPTEPPYDD